ncbi:MAG TPA: hypothetical protein VIF57_15700 [Polyangia bacterium]
MVGATDLERTLLQAARRERPSPELTRRMAAGLGISAAVAAAPAAAASAVVAKATVVSWVPATVLAAAVAAGVVGVSLASRHAGGGAADRAPQTQTAAQAPGIVAARVEEAPPPADTEPARVEKRAEKVHRRATPPAPAADLRDQIALIDAARTAVKAGATDRALALLRRYEANYAGGAFRPEALALRIEALDAGGHGAEARALARDFLARYPQSPVADRVARIAH